MKNAHKSALNFKEPTLVWLGDPCYAPAFSHYNGNDDVWQELCRLLGEAEEADEDCTSFVFEHEGVEFVLGGTAHGDGCYPVSSGGQCGVDAGLLSVIPAGKLGLNPEANKDYGGVFTTVEGMCYVDTDHTLHAGSHTIKTDYDDEEDDECCDYCGWDYQDCTC